MRAPQVRTGEPGRRLQHRPGDVALRRHELAPEDVRVEVGQPPPVAGDDVDMPEPRTAHADTSSRSIADRMPEANGRDNRFPPVVCLCLGDP